MKIRLLNGPFQSFSMKKYALISVFDKSKIETLCKVFKKHNIHIISTGSTSAYINQMGYNNIPVSKITNFKEILDGRVKTLHPNIYSSILFDRKNKSHINELKKIKNVDIEYVIVNLYPFKENLNKKVNHDRLIEMIDIGGLSLLRAAAKNYNYVTPVCNLEDYHKLCKNINENKGSTSLSFRKKMASKIFNKTSDYDKDISEWLGQKSKYEDMKIHNHTKINLRYGENPHQKSYFYKNNNKNTFYDNVIQGKQLSYNNLKDIDVGFNCVNEFSKPTSVIIKHCSPCGVASSNNICSAFLESKKTDTISSFGGIVVLNKAVNDKAANLIIQDFYEVVLAPKFSKSSLEILKKRKNLIVIKTKKIKDKKKQEVESTNNGYLIQEKNLVTLKHKDVKLVSKFKCTKKEIDDLIFAFKVCKYVKSNAIVLASKQKTISISGGQTSRIQATKIAINKIAKRKESFVVASDAFFPFIDNIKTLNTKNCIGIIQPSGSKNDLKIIDYSNKINMPLYFTKFRFFKH